MMFTSVNVPEIARTELTQLLNSKTHNTEPGESIKATCLSSFIF